MGQDWYCVVWQRPSDKVIYAFDAGRDSTDESAIRLAKITPSATHLNDPFAFGYWDDYLGIISLKPNKWFYASIELSDANRD